MLCQGANVLSPRDQRTVIAEFPEGTVIVFRPDLWTKTLDLHIHIIHYQPNYAHPTKYVGYIRL